MFTENENSVIHNTDLFAHLFTFRLSREALTAQPKLTTSLLYTLCSEKKHPHTFSFISPCVMCRFKQKLQ